MKRLVLAAAVLVPMTWALASGPHAGPGTHKHRGHHAPGQLVHHRPPHSPPLHVIGAEIGLEATQVDALEALAAGLHDAHDARRAAHEEARALLFVELTQDAPDFETLEAMAVAEAEAMHAAHLDHIAGMRALAETLDDDQRARLVAHLERRPLPPPRR